MRTAIEISDVLERPDPCQAFKIVERNGLPVVEPQSSGSPKTTLELVNRLRED